MLLEKVTDNQIIIYIMAVLAVVGTIAELIARMINNRLVREGKNIHHSNHPLMKLVKAKYEHANLVTERVQNVEAFVDKYLYEYRVMGMKYRRWQCMGIKCAWGVLGVSIIGAAILYSKQGEMDSIVEILLCGCLLGSSLFLLHALLNERYKLEAIRTYIVDYLQNVCAHRYSKPEAEEIVVEPLKAEKENKPATEMRIREILEEFLA